jgi:hypothetical protein
VDAVCNSSQVASALAVCVLLETLFSNPEPARLGHLADDVLPKSMISVDQDVHHEELQGAYAAVADVPSSYVA